MSERIVRGTEPIRSASFEVGGAAHGGKWSAWDL
jgi:hypothetical protein